MGKKVKLLDNDVSFNIDVDKTLLFDPEIEGITLDALRLQGIPTVKIVNPYNGSEKTFVVHQEHLNLLKDHKARGFKVTIWSNNGAKYAYAVGEALGIQDYVEWASAKPTKCCDDLTPDQYMPRSIYIKDNAYLKLFGVKL